MKLKFYELRKWLLMPIFGIIATGASAQYCSVGITYDVEPITRVQFGTIDNVSSGTVNGSPVQEDFTSISTALVPGSTVPITLFGNTAGNWTNYFRVYIDWNGNENFEEPGESYDIGTIVNCANCSVSGSILVPAAPPATTTRMRVVKKYNAYGTSCETLGFGQAEDYTVMVNAAPCAGIPNGGTANSSAASACPSVSFSLSVAGASTGLGLTYQWQSSPDGLVWTDVLGATNSSYNTTLTQNTSYRRRIICNAGPDTAYSSAVSVNVTPFLNCYCASAVTSTGDEDIVLVETGTLSNSSPANCDLYTDFTALTPTNLLQGVPYSIRVDVGDCSGPSYYDHGVAVFIDYNHNGQFTDPGETIFANPIQPANAVVTHSGTYTIPGSALPGITRMRVSAVEAMDGADISPCGDNVVFFSSYGEVEDYYVNIIPPPADEAGALAITKPAIAACSLGSQIWVNLQNLGSNPLTSVNYTVRVNGLNIPVANPVTVNVPSGATVEVQIPITYSLADGDSVSVEVSMPNGQVEDPLLAFNNLTTRRIYAGLSGEKSVYGAGADFADVDAAIDALTLRGVCDTVYFQIESNSYSTQHTFLPYPGAGVGRLAVFESASGNAGDVNFAYAAASPADNFTFNFDGANGYMVRNLTLTAADPTYAKAITFANAPKNIWIDNNIIVGDTTANYDAGDFERINIAGFDNSNPKNIYITNNQIIGGNRSIDIEGSTTGYASNFTIEGNTFEDFNVLAALVANVSNPVFNNNILRHREGVSGAVYGYYALRTIDAGSVSGNDIQSMNDGFDVYLSNVKGGIDNFLVSNNFLYNADSSSTVSAGIYVGDPNSSDIVIANNSIAFNNDASNSGAIYLQDGSQIRLFNNNIGAFGNSPAIRVEKSYSVSAANNNNLFGTTLANWVGSTQATLAGLQSTTGMNANSVSVNPGFNGADLHTCAPALNGAGTSLSYVTDDFDADVRGTMPDIGADEFLGDANNLLIEDAFLKCPSEVVVLGNTSQNGVTYTWTPSGNTSSINATAAGTYIITATSSCGSFSDTAVVTNKPLPTASFTSATVGLSAIFTNTSTNGTTYMWDFGDGQTSTSANPSHVYENEGTYSVSLTVTNECGTATFGPNAVNVINAGIEETSTIEVSLFPNPTNGQFTVTMSSVNTTETVVSIIDVTGKTIMVKNIPAGVNQISLDATSFASGVYSVKISNGEFTKVIRMVRK